MTNSKYKQRVYYRTWYEKQKREGRIVYKIVFKTGDVYVSATENSLKQRIRQHKSNDRSNVLRRKGYDTCTAEYIVLESVPLDTDLKEREQYWRDLLKPNVNSVKQPTKRKGCSKGGVWFEDIWYPTKYELWRDRNNNVPYGTFKSRQFRGFDISKALGLK